MYMMQSFVSNYYTGLQKFLKQSALKEHIHLEMGGVLKYIWRLG